MPRYLMRQGYELFDVRGNRVAGPGEYVDADHPAIATCEGLANMAFLVADEPVAPARAASAPVRRSSWPRGTSADDKGADSSV